MMTVWREKSGKALPPFWGNYSTARGTSVGDLTGNANSSNSPTVKYYTNSVFELRISCGDNYGSRVRTLLTPTVSGSYTFWIASDDSSELWFSTKAMPETNL